MKRAALFLLALLAVGCGTHTVTHEVRIVPGPTVTVAGPTVTVTHRVTVAPAAAPAPPLPPMPHVNGATAAGQPPHRATRLSRRTSRRHVQSGDGATGKCVW